MRFCNSVIKIYLKKSLFKKNVTLILRDSKREKREREKKISLFLPSPIFSVFDNNHQLFSSFPLYRAWHWPCRDSEQQVVQEWHSVVLLLNDHARWIIKRFSADQNAGPPCRKKSHKSDIQSHKLPVELKPRNRYTVGKRAG